VSFGNAKCDQQWMWQCEWNDGKYCSREQSVLRWHRFFCERLRLLDMVVHRFKRWNDGYVFCQHDGHHPRWLLYLIVVAESVRYSWPSRLSAPTPAAASPHPSVQTRR
jgi:hypothetical protein